MFTRRLPQHTGTAEPGFSVGELLAVLAVLAVTLLVSLPALREFYLSARTSAATSTVQGAVLQARITALKEKTHYRVLIHDEDDSTPNRIELQRKQGASFVSLSTQPDPFNGVRVLNGGSTNSMDIVAVAPRGLCSSGQVFLKGSHDSLVTISVDSTCLTSVSE